MHAVMHCALVLTLLSLLLLQQCGVVEFCFSRRRFILVEQRRRRSSQLVALDIRGDGSPSHHRDTHSCVQLHSAE